MTSEDNESNAAEVPLDDLDQVQGASSSKQPKRDIEESDEILEFEEPDPIGFWEALQRDLVTNHVDYNLKTLADLIGNQAIDLSPRYQRRARWDAARQSRLMESFLMNVPVPPVFLNEDEYGKYSIIDGKQRLTAIHEFLRGRLKLSGLKVFGELNGSSFDDLPPSLRNVVETRATLRAVIILRQSDRQVKFEVFQRLNTGGVRLNAQEIRNSTWTGPLNDLILDLSTNAEFHKLLGIRDRRRSAIYREMRDAEFVLRFFTFRESWTTFAGGMRREMDNFMVDNQHLSQAELDVYRQDFLGTLSGVANAFGNHAFKRWVPEKGHWRQQILASLYDAEMFACRGLDSGQLARANEQVIANVQEMFSDNDFRKSIDAATNTPSLFQFRIRKMRAVIEETLEG